MKLLGSYLCFWLLTTLSCTQGEGPVEIIKCCQEGFILNQSYDCVKSSVNFLEAAANSKSGVRTQPENLQISGYKKPVCNVKLEHHEINRRNVLTASGGALSYKYKDEFKKEDVCFDILEELNGDQNFVFLNCDPCTEKACVNLCCPHGHAYKDDLKSEVSKSHRCDAETEPWFEKRCQVHDDEEDLVWSEDLWAEETGVSTEKKKDVLFVSAGDSFKCPGKKILLDPWSGFGLKHMRLEEDGPLHVLLEDAKQNETFPASEFCLSFTDRHEYDYYFGDNEQNESSPVTFPSPSEKKIQPLYAVCHELNNEKSSWFYYPIFSCAANFISCFFILVTIIIYVILQDLRSNLFGKITLGFLCNVFFCYLFRGIHSLDSDSFIIFKLGFCTFLGYIIHHTTIALFFWTNAMAINITHKFSNILLSSKEENQKNYLLINICYAQGVPMLITLVTALIDAYGDCDGMLPNMGRHSCILGRGFNPDILFIFTPVFLYSHLIISVIMISNLICFLLTGYYLTSHWNTVRNTTQTSDGDNLWLHTMVVFKIIIFMGISWTLDVIYSAIAHLDLYPTSFDVLDVLNLLTGLVIFLVLICKETVFKKLLKKLCPGYEHGDGDTLVMNMEMVIPEEKEGEETSKHSSL